MLTMIDDCVWIDLSRVISVHVENSSVKPWTVVIHMTGRSVPMYLPFTDKDATTNFVDRVAFATNTI